MKKLQNRLWAKLLAGFLLIVFAFSALAAGLAGAMLAATGVYDDGGTAKIDTLFADISPSLDAAMSDALRYYRLYRSHSETPDAYDPQWEEPYLRRFAPENSNFYFAVYDAQGTLVFSGGAGETLKNEKTDFAASRYRCQQSTVFDVQTDRRAVSKRVIIEGDENFWNYINEQYLREDTSGFRYEIVEETERGITADVSYDEFRIELYTLVGYVRENMTAEDGLRQEYLLLSWAVSHRVLLIVLAALGAVGMLAMFVFLMYAAGHAAGHEGIHLNWFDRIPLDVLTLLYLLPLLFGVRLLNLISFPSDTGSMLVLQAALVAAYLICGLSLLLSYASTLASRIKAGTWYQNTVIWRVLTFLWRVLCHLGRTVRYLCRNLPLYWRSALVWAGLCFIELIFIMITGCTGSFFLWWLLGRTILTAALVLAVINMKKLRDGGEKLASGALTSQIDTSHMFWEFKRHAENLNSIADGMQKAVEQQMRSERLKTELITNVSHDIKTPLTSIVSYVDLLKKEKMPSDAARQYLDVLDRQSARLKKLTEDLVEASKASTGNLSCTLEPTDVNVLLGQVMGEYEGKLEAGQLEPIVLEDPSSPKILADGRLLWRVFDNLLSNICKYAMPGTRVYLSSAVENGKVVICFKNISRSALNISADELIERFVRGDSSRNTEGSGLGLSIAQSLTSLQQGTFALSVDGDLFKASVTFDALS